ncbi:MAG TPA: NTP pyrophosphohydrolase [Pseudonocardiaceae bacterium]
MTNQHDDRPPLLIVDAANVVGSVPDGWWRDRAGANQRLRDSLATLAADGLAGPGLPEWVRHPPLEVVLVVEGAARKVGGIDQVRVVSAPGSGDDAIVTLVRDEGTDRPCAVVTADRELRNRVTALGASVLGPRTVRPGVEP